MFALFANAFAPIVVTPSGILIFVSPEQAENADAFISLSVLGNSIAILCGACEKDKSGAVCEKLWNDASLTPVSLSMKCFFYDASLLVDREYYRTFILEDIEKCYLPMVEYGVGTVWETEIGERDFSRAGSLCHGWSALPIYYYHIL